MIRHVMQQHRPISLDHLDRITDSTGMIQHAIYSVPRRESGYTTDDNARALRFCTRLWRHRAEQSILNRVSVYLSFVEHARCPGRGFHNFLSYDRRWLDAEGCGDCQGQAVRGLAEVLGSDLPEGYRTLARELINSVLPCLVDLRSLRAQALVVLAWGHLWSSGVKEIEPLESVAWSAAGRLVECYRRAQRYDWPWFESRLTYANAVLPHALFVAAQRWPNEPFLEIAEASYIFLDSVTTCGGVFWPIGNQGWFPHGDTSAAYDQQPVEAATMAESAVAAFALLGKEECLATLQRAYGWFHGENSLGLPLASRESGACYDGLQVSGVNRNQGAESTLACLWTELQCFEVQQSREENQAADAVA
jgi:hypothetical protein